MPSMPGLSRVSFLEAEAPRASTTRDELPSVLIAALLAVCLLSPNHPSGTASIKNRVTSAFEICEEVVDGLGSEAGG